MRKYNINQAKKLTIEQIKQMREYKRKGLPVSKIARHFGINPTTLLWHTADIQGKNWVGIE